MRRAAFIIGMVLLSLASSAEELKWTVSGVVYHENTPLPGVTVSVHTADRVVAIGVTDARGLFTLKGAAADYYQLTAEMEGMDSTSQELYVGRAAEVLAAPMSLELKIIDDPITIACGPPCDGEGLPTCEEYEKNRELESKAASDARALAELRDQYGRATTREERARIGGILVALVDDDAEYFTPLAESADLLLSFAEQANGKTIDELPQYRTWCESVGRDPETEQWLLESETGALLGSADPLLVPLAHRALLLRDYSLQFDAMNYTSLTCDPSLLRSVDENLDTISMTTSLGDLAMLVPCADPVLNEKIFLLEDGAARDLLPDAIVLRNDTLKRLGRFPGAP